MTDSYSISVASSFEVIFQYPLQSAKEKAATVSGVHPRMPPLPTTCPLDKLPRFIATKSERESKSTAERTEGPALPQREPLGSR